MGRSSRVSKGVTRVIEKRTITTGKQMNLRFTGLDEDALSMMVEKIDSNLPQKNISRSRVLRAIGYLHEDEEIVNKLCQSILLNT